MELWILDNTYETVGLIDVYESFIWTERYNSTGDFELYLPASKAIIDLLKQDRYIEINDSKTLMIIEAVQTETYQSGSIFLKVTGRTIDSILDRRIIWNKITYSGSLQNLVEKILNENVISPSDGKRKIPNFVFKKSVEDKVVNSTVSETQYHGENVFEVIKNLCVQKDLGFRVVPYGEGGFEFELYSGADRSYDQELLPWVVFSPEYDNLAGSTSIESKALYKNAILVFGTEIGDTKNQYTSSATVGDFNGLDRRETCLESSGVSKQDEEGNDIPDSTYLAQLSTKGREALAETKITKGFDGDINAVDQFIFGKDFFLGDLVQVVDYFGQEDVVRVTEVIISDDRNGYIITPSFTYSEDREGGTG